MTRTPPHLITLAGLTSLSVLSLSLFLPALPAMAQDFGTSPKVMALAMSGYMIGSAVMQLVLGPLSDRLGRRPVMLSAMTLYVLASLGAFLAQDVTVFLICRFFQAVVVAGSVLSQAVIRDIYPPEQAASRMGLVAAAMALAPMVGPMLGGALTDAAGWRAAFALYSVAGMVALVAVWWDLGETLTRAKDGWRDQMRAYGALVASRVFWGFALCMAFSVGSFFVFLSGVPFVAAGQFGLSAPLIGLGLGSISGGFLLGSLLTARLAPIWGLARLILVGRLVPFLGLSLGLVLFTLGASHPLALFGTTVFVGVGNGLTMANANSGAMSINPALAGSAAGLAGALSVLCGAVLSTITVALLEWQGGPITLLGVMLASVIVSMAAAALALLPRRQPV